ncbi:SAM-dependent methyltransferase [Salipaludibacillus keqinensis]|uniref:tRNA 5-hydroxyuridine methyltransferase n=1 Tax=Salipaludibacillus keqinensis TaxID=2045207 RepID=A0A323TN56_9BACI|nr:O-methyltransferase [Salipaludibacillus keqinensis]PYZ94173.1 SAM-dependent methyltransferase [Salipaludibacillus keqinensis]
METVGKTDEYIRSLIQERSPLIKEMEAYAEEHQVPIMELDGMETLLQFLRIQQPDHILEIGTAIGYSAIRMLLTLPQAQVTSIERDIQRAALAKENGLKAKVNNRFQIIEGDALEVSEIVQTNGPFDALFIDAAKGQYERFFALYEPMVKENGLIFSDNVLFKGMVASERKPESRGVKAMVNKLTKYNEKLMSDQRFHSILLPIGDGILVSRKIK